MQLTSRLDETSGSSGRPKIDRSAAARRGRRCGSPARSLAERARGLAAVSASLGATSACPSLSKVAARSCCFRQVARAATRLPERSAKKRLTMRSSSEWKVTTTSRPPGFSARSAANSAWASSPSSSLTKMRSAWKTRVAGWILSFVARPMTRLDQRRRGRACVANGRFGAALLDASRDAARMPLLAEEAEDAGEVADLGAVDDIGGADARPAPCACRADRRAEGKAALGLVELHRGDADVEHDAVEPAVGA